MAENNKIYEKKIKNISVVMSMWGSRNNLLFHIREWPTTKVTYMQRLVGRDRVDHVNILGKSVPKKN